MTVGDKLRIQPTFDKDYSDERKRAMDCVVVYIHPDDRYYVVEFRSDLGIPWRETFYPATRRIRAKDYRDASSPDVGF